jgi:PII-like signaling protein
MQLTGSATRALIFLGEDDTWHHKPLHHEIVKRAREAGLAGATVLHGCEGFGGSSLVHTDRILNLTEDLPIVVIIVDAEVKIRAFLPELDELMTDGTVLLDEVEVLRYQGKQQP